MHIILHPAVLDSIPSYPAKTLTGPKKKPASVLGQPLPVDEVMLCKVLHAAGHLDGHVGHVPKVQDPLGLPGAGNGHGQVRLGAVGEQVLVQVTLGRALKDQAPAMCMLLVKIPGGQAGCPDFDVRGGNIDVTHLLANFPV